MRPRLASAVIATTLLIAFASCSAQLVLSRDNATVNIEGYAPNIVRVTMSLDKQQALKGPGVGIVAHAANDGWTGSLERGPGTSARDGVVGFRGVDPSAGHAGR